MLKQGGIPELRRAAKSQGLAVHPAKTRPFYLKGYGFDPKTVFDVGVFAGTPWLYNAFPASQFVLIDPQPGCEERVRATGHLSKFDFHAVALGPEAGDAQLHIPSTAKGQGGAMASLLDRRDKLAETFVSVAEETVPMRRLDDIAVDYAGPFGLKIDTEGFEVQVLQGGPDTLQRCEFVILELSVTQRFAGMSPPSHVLALLAQAGLEFRDVLAVADAAGKRARPRHMDVLFTRWSGDVAK